MLHCQVVTFAFFSSKRYDHGSSELCRNKKDVKQTLHTKLGDCRTQLENYVHKNVILSLRVNFIHFRKFRFVPKYFQLLLLGGKPGLPDMGCCKHVLGTNVFRGPPCTTSRWTTLTIFCWKEMAAIFQNGRHVKVILRNI